MPSADERDDLLDELEELARKETNGEYSQKRCDLDENVRAVKICKWWYQWVNKYSLSREVINLAYNVYRTHVSHERKKGKFKLTEHEDHSISTASLFIAIKGKYPRMYEVVEEESIAYTLVRDFGGNAADVPALYGMEREMLSSSLAGGGLHDITTMHHFAYCLCKLHPVIDLQPSLLNYFHSATCFQVENAFLHANLMWGYKPSEIAFAAMLRIVDNVDEDECDRLLEELSPFIGAVDHDVVLAMGELHTAVPDFPRSEEFEAVMAASIAARRRAEAIRLVDATYHRPESPCCVTGV